jgi:uncharacterized Tic20 family protein
VGVRTSVNQTIPIEVIRDTRVVTPVGAKTSVNPRSADAKTVVDPDRTKIAKPGNTARSVAVVVLCSVVLILCNSSSVLGAGISIFAASKVSDKRVCKYARISIAFTAVCAVLQLISLAVFLLFAARVEDVYRLVNLFTTVADSFILLFSIAQLTLLVLILIKTHKKAASK